ncbi:unnamed protein product, partial [Prorocentrum cordatum]
GARAALSLTAIARRGGWDLGYDSQMQVAWRAGVKDSSKLKQVVPGCAMARKHDGETRPVATFSDGAARAAPNASEVGLDKPLSSNEEYRGTKDNKDVAVAWVNHATRGVWLQIKEGKEQRIEDKSFRDERKKEATAFAIDIAKLFIEGK